jgi:hypothetical protein
MSVPSLRRRSLGKQEMASVAPWANRGQTANFRQKAPKIHVSPQFVASVVHDGINKN